MKDALGFTITTLITIWLLALVGCGQDDPYATQYKNRQLESANNNGSTQNGSDNRPTPASERSDDATNDAEQPAAADEDAPPAAAEEADKPAETPAEDVDPAVVQQQQQAALVAMGQQVYAQTCGAVCHGPIAESTKRNRTAAQILMAATIVPHANLTWPNQQQAMALEAALKD